MKKPNDQEIVLWMTQNKVSVSHFASIKKYIHIVCDFGKDAVEEIDFKDFTTGFFIAEGLSLDKARDLSLTLRYSSKWG